jgi:hypothetical protein
MTDAGSRAPTPTDDWRPLRLLVASPAQAIDELLRPIVLFGPTPAARAHQTGVSERTLRRRGDRVSAAHLPGPPIAV